MRLLIANDGVADAGGVDTYLRSIIPRLRASGCDVAFLHTGPAGLDGSAPCDRVFHAWTTDLGPTLQAVEAWSPDVCFSHNMSRLEVDDALVARWPVVKMMHGYFGTCISGQKTRLAPSASPCSRTFGVPCLAQYLPRHCGERSLTRMFRGFSWARAQQQLLRRYAAVVVASGHMREEYRRHGVPDERLRAIPLFGPAEAPWECPVSPVTSDVLFLGRMTPLKGGDLLVRAAARAGEMLQRPVALVMAGDGPARESWEAIARRQRLNATFVGWVDTAMRERLCAGATVLAVPSIWPEPFGLVGLEAARAGVPAVARDCGGIREWLRDGWNGLLVSGPPEVAPLADALLRVLSDPSLRAQLSRGARQVAQELTLTAHVDALVRHILQPAAAHAVPR